MFGDRDEFKQIVVQAWPGLTFLFAVLCGLSAIAGKWYPLLVLGGVVYVILGAYWPLMLVVGVFVGVLADAVIVDRSIGIAGLPISPSKVATLALIGLWTVRCVVLKKRPVEWTPVTAGLLLILSSMIASVGVALEPSRAWKFIAGVSMLTVLVHVLYRVLKPEDLPLLGRFIAIALIVVMVNTLFFQREVLDVRVLDQAWRERTSGAYLDPNMWATAVLVITPVAIGSLAGDKHWSALILLPLICGLFPATIVQSMSRAGLLVMLAISPGLLWALRKHKTLLLVGGVAFLIVLPRVVNLEAALLRYQTLVDPTLEGGLGHGSLDERTGLLIAGMKMVQDHWLTGVGVGMFPVHASYVTGGWVFKIAHNSYMNVAAEQGIFGILTHIYFIFTVALLAWNAAFGEGNEHQKAIGMGFLVGAAAYGAMAATLNLATFNLAYIVLTIGMVIHKKDRLLKENGLKPGTKEGEELWEQSIA